MIRAQHRKWARLIFNRYIDRLLRKYFTHFFLVNEPPSVEKSYGLMVTPNHFSWWDGFFIDFVMRRFSDRKIYIMMLEDQLRRYWFFKKLGAYSINPNNPRSIAESLAYTGELLRDTGNYVVFYPQGEIQSFDKHPITLKPGLQRILRMTKISTIVIPAAFKIVYSDEMLPSVYCRFGEPLKAEHLMQDYSIFENAFKENISDLNEATHRKEKIADLFN